MTCNVLPCLVLDLDQLQSTCHVWSSTSITCHDLTSTSMSGPRPRSTSIDLPCLVFDLDQLQSTCHDLTSTSIDFDVWSSTSLDLHVWSSTSINFNRLAMSGLRPRSTSIDLHVWSSIAMTGLQLHSTSMSGLRSTSLDHLPCLVFNRSSRL
jgi:hypothetical protein